MSGACSSAFVQEAEADCTAPQPRESGSDKRRPKVSIDLFETTGSSPPEGAIAVAELESQEPALEAEAPEVGFEAPRLRHRLTPPPPAQCVRIVRAKYPEALVCMGCGTLLASEAKS